MASKTKSNKKATRKKQRSSGEISNKKPEMKFDKDTPRLESGKTPGRLTVEDYEELLGLVDVHLSALKPLSREWSQYSELRAKIEKKIKQLETKPERKEKKEIRWICLDCNETFTKAEQVRRCKTCKSENIEQREAAEILA